MRPVVIKYAENTAKRMLFNAANRAIAEVLEEEEVDYSDVAEVKTDANGKVTAIQVDAVAINMLKSRITLKISELVQQNDEFNTYIPIGTFLDNEYTNGLGPKIKFSMQMTSYAVVNFKNEFTETAMNQSVHRITLDVTVNGGLVMAGARDYFKTETSAIVAETVIVGEIPDAYTEVIEAPYDDIAETINDYGAAEN